MSLATFIAKRFLMRSKGSFSAFIIRMAIFATCFGVAIIIVSMSLINGFQKAITAKLDSFWGQVQVVPFNPNPASIITDEPILKNDTLIQALKGNSQIKTITPFILKPAILQAHSTMEGIRMKGVDRTYKIPNTIKINGHFIDYNDTAYAAQIIVSEMTAKRLNIQLNDTIRLNFVEQGNSLPKIRKLAIVGLYHTGMEDLDQQFAICDIRLLQRLCGWNDNQINGYQIESKTDVNPDSLAQSIYQNNLTLPLYAYSIHQTYEGIFSWLGMQDVNGRILIIIVIIVALINICAAILILIVDRKKTIGVLQALGAPLQLLRKVYIRLAFLIGVLGIFLGNILGIGLCFLQQQFGFLHLPEANYYVNIVPISIPWKSVVLLDISTLLLCLFMILIPTLYLNKLIPAQELGR